MAIVSDQFPKREPQFTRTVSATEKWPDRHPRSKPRTCTICGEEARLYAGGPRCDEHSPNAERLRGAA